MAIPDYQTIMLPLLQYASDGKEHASREPVEPLTSTFGLSADEQHTYLKNGKPLFADRVSWALAYLCGAGLLERTRRGYFRITKPGLNVLASHPQYLDNRFLAQYPEFRAFLGKSKRSSTGLQIETDASGNGTSTAVVVKAIQQRQTPTDMLEEAYQAIRQGLAEELIARIKRCPSTFFEQLVVELLVAMGYGGSRKDAGEAVGRSGDEGIDGTIKEDRLGLDTIYIQAKRWEDTVGRPEIHKFVGALAGRHARKGIFITTSTFSKDAQEYVGGVETKIALIDGKRLAEFMIDHGVGVTTTSTYEVKRIDSDYFPED